ncbi:MAG: toll/interleukin-1 receptor domain-containing protein [Chloroflexota bacterium]
MQHHIFLSYSRQDTDIMRRVRDDLRKAGLSVWTDEGIEPGSPSWEQTIQNAVEQSVCLIVLLSPSAKNSTWIRREVGYAEDTAKKAIFPVLVRGTISNATPIRLISHQLGANLTSPADFDSQMAKLITSVRQVPFTENIEPHQIEDGITHEHKTQSKIYVRYMVQRKRRIQDRDDEIYRLDIDRNFAGIEAAQCACERDLRLMDIDYELQDLSLNVAREYHLKRMRILIDYYYKEFELSLNRSFEELIQIRRNKEKDLGQLNEEYKLLYGSLDIAVITEDLYKEAIKIAQEEKWASAPLFVARLIISDNLADEFMSRMKIFGVVQTNSDEDGRYLII